MPDILSTITAKRLQDIEKAKLDMTVLSLESRIQERYPSPPIDLYNAIASIPGMAVAAEFKRASPSKGAFVPVETQVDQFARDYTEGGANLISVLTEPTWFKGHLEDMERARQVSSEVAASLGLPSRPLILRKDFILDSHQVLEARAFGADTLLLIVASLPTPEVLSPLIKYARSLHMEPLVEVNNVAELKVAKASGARVIGINNRNLRTFEVDLGTTTTIVAEAAAGLTEENASSRLAILSLSGIKCGKDVTSLASECAASPGGLAIMRGFLIGEALMQSPTPISLVRELREAGVFALLSNPPEGGGGSFMAVSHTGGARLAGGAVGGGLSAKICGLTSQKSAVMAASAGAHFLGFIFVPQSSRTVDPENVAQWLESMRGGSRGSGEAQALLNFAARLKPTIGLPQGAVDGARLETAGCLLRAAVSLSRYLAVGVFRDEAPSSILARATLAKVDCVQLHGEEASGDFANFPIPIIKVMHLPAGGSEGGAGSVREACTKLAKNMAEWSTTAALLLLDTSGGGSGVQFNHATLLPALDIALSSLPGKMGIKVPVPVWLAGGLIPETLLQNLKGFTKNLKAARCVYCTIQGLDVSSGTEWGKEESPSKRDLVGSKDPNRVLSFIAACGGALS